MDKKIYDKNSEILYLYDCKLCNPNGDPDDENKPRMDYETGRNLVSDVRLKRYIRDYLQQEGYEIYVSQLDGKAVTAGDRLKAVFDKNDKKVSLSKLSKDDRNWLLEQLIDVRMFGATMPIKSEGSGGGSSEAFTGPVQFNWGYSLNKVSMVDSSTITSHFASDAKNAQGAIGKDYRLYYSLVAFYGIISGTRAEKTLLSERDVTLLDKSLLKAIPLVATTRSKNNQMPRLIVRVEYKDSSTFLGDFRRYVKLIPKVSREESIRDLPDFEADVNSLVSFLSEHKNDIEKVKIYQDSNLSLKGGETLKEMLINAGFDEGELCGFNDFE